LALTGQTSGLEQILGALGTTFRLTRLYPASHPAVVEAMRNIAGALTAVAADSVLEWKVGATGLHLAGQQLAPRNAQIAELAGLLFTRGVRGIELHGGVTPEHLLALIGVATGGLPPDDASLGRISLLVNRRTSQRLSSQQAGAVPAVAPAAAATGAAAATPAEQVAARRHSAVFRPDVVPADIEAKRAVAALRAGETAAARRAAVEQIQTLAPALVGLRDVAAVAETVCALDQALRSAQDTELIDAIGLAAGALSEPATVQRLVQRLGELHVPPAERALLVTAVGALASMAAPLVLEAFLSAPPDRREPFRAAIRAAMERAIEPLQPRLSDPRTEAVVTAAEFLGLTGSPQAVPLLLPLVRHEAAGVREAALLALAEIGSRDIVRPAMPALKDDNPGVRIAAARAISIAGDASATAVLVRRLDAEEDEGVQAELLRAVGRLNAPEALEVLARFAEPGGLLKRRTPYLRAAAIEGLGHLTRPEARALLELYRQEKEPTVRRAAEAALK
jgi:HEAT repeat protein